MPVKRAKGQSLAEVLRDWVRYDEQTHNTRGWSEYPIEEVWPHREYTWSRDCARMSIHEWDQLVEAFKEFGWDPRDPAILYFGKNGVVKVGEGNHRLAVARELGFEKVPVRFVFWNEVRLNRDICRTPGRDRRALVEWRKKEYKADQELYAKIGPPPNRFWRSGEDTSAFFEKWREEMDQWLVQRECCVRGDEACCHGGDD